MKRISPAIALLLLTCIGLSACGAASTTFACTDRLGCVQVGAGEALRIGHTAYSDDGRQPLRH